MNEQKTEWKLVPVPATTEMVSAIESAVDAQLTASGIEPSAMHRQDGDAIFAAAMAVAPGAPAGFVLVPLAATEEQLDAAHEAHDTPDEGSEIEYRAEYRRTYRAMLAAAPHAPGWSSCTKPGPDGYQRTVQVPGMPGAAADAAYERAADLCHKLVDLHGVHSNFLCATAILSLKSTAAPALAAVEWNARCPCGTPDSECPCPRTGLPLCSSAEAPAAPAPVQQAAPSGLPDGVTLNAFVGADTKEWHITIQHPFGTSWVRMGQSRDVQLAELIAARPTADSAAPAQPAALSEPVAYIVRSPSTGKERFMSKSKKYLVEMWERKGYEVAPLFTTHQKGGV
jgi:hypothetical protein